MNATTRCFLAEEVRNGTDSLGAGRRAGDHPDEMNRLFKTFFDQPAPTRSGSPTSRRWMPAMDLVETADHYVLRADLPGLSDDDVNLQREDNVLTISGEPQTQHEPHEEGHQRIERPFGNLAPLAHPPRRRRPRRGAGPLRPRRARDPNPQTRTEKAPTGPDRPRHSPNRRHQDDREHRRRRPASQQRRPGPSTGLIHELPYRPSTIADRGLSPPRSAHRRPPSPISRAPRWADRSYAPNQRLALFH